MSSDRGGLLKARAQSFARHLQNRLKTLSDSQDDAWSDSGDAEVYYDIESPLASPDEEAVEPIFIATQNRDGLPLQRTDSEASTYYDTLDSLEELKTLSPEALVCKAGNSVVSPNQNGCVDLLDNHSSKDSFETSSLLKLNESVLGNIYNFSDAGHSGTFDSFLLELETVEKKTDKVCDIHAPEENNNVGKDLEDRASSVSNSCDVDVAEVGINAPASEVSASFEPEDVYCVFCDIEQIKTDLVSDCSEGCEISRVSCENETNNSQLNGFLEEDLCTPCNESREHVKVKDYRRSDHEVAQEMNGREIPQIVVENNINECVYSDGNSSLSNLLQELKIEITKESLDDNVTTGTDRSDRLETLSVDAKESSSVLGAKSKGSEVDEFDIATKRKHFQRSSSLKTGKTPPGTPGRKKIVRFADVLGLDLADVKTFLDEVPTVPKSAFDDLHCCDFSVDQTSEPPSSTFTVVVPQLEKVLTPLFQQPCSQPNFLERVRQKNVCLENAVVSDMSLFAITGLVRVKNVHFHKSVHVRYTTNNWHSFSDLQARYVPNSCDGFSDKFTFLLYAHTLSVGRRLEFAVRFQTAGAQFWDNNGGLNYAFVCGPLLQASGLPLPVSVSVSSDVTAAFY